MDDEFIEEDGQASVGSGGIGGRPRSSHPSGRMMRLNARFTEQERAEIEVAAAVTEQPVRAARHAPAQTVWHTSLRNHPQDRILSDEQWGQIAAELIAGVGLAPHGDTNAVRWVAVRHDDYGIHV